MHWPQGKGAGNRSIASFVSAFSRSRLRGSQRRCGGGQSQLGGCWRPQSEGLKRLSSVRPCPATPHFWPRPKGRPKGPFFSPFSRLAFSALSRASSRSRASFSAARPCAMPYGRSTRKAAQSHLQGKMKQAERECARMRGPPRPWPKRRKLGSHRPRAPLRATPCGPDRQSLWSPLHWSAAPGPAASVSLPG
jgi:hypothetical protein